MARPEGFEPPTLCLEYKSRKALVEDFWRGAGQSRAERRKRALGNDFTTLSIEASPVPAA